MSDVLTGLSRVFLDSAPVIYFVEKHPFYFSILEPLFRRFETGELVAVTSPITLAECVVLPVKQGNLGAVDAFIEILGGNDPSTFVPIQRETARMAADIRSRFNVTLLDAFQIAAALGGRCDALLTNDKDLCRVTDVKVILVEELG